MNPYTTKCTKEEARRIMYSRIYQFRGGTSKNWNYFGRKNIEDKYLNDICNSMRQLTIKNSNNNNIKIRKNLKRKFPWNSMNIKISKKPRY